jgi:hypothetical protein
LPLALLLFLKAAEEEIENAFGGRHARKGNYAGNRRDSHKHRAAPHALTRQLCTQRLLHPTQQTRRSDERRLPGFTIMTDGKRAMSKRRMEERKMRIIPKRCVPSSWPGMAREPRI